MSNQFLPFATSGGANALTPIEWAALTAILANGFQSGVASSEQFNTAFRQALAGTNLLGNFINDQGFNALDDGNTANLLTAFKNALQNLLALKGGATGQAFLAADGATGKQVVNVSQFAASIAAGGYQRLPSGVIIQWGAATLPTGNGDVVTLPITFPNDILRVVSSDSGSGCNSTGWLKNGTSKSSFLGYGKLEASSYSNTGYNYVAFGY